MLTIKQWVKHFKCSLPTITKQNMFEKLKIFKEIYILWMISVSHNKVTYNLYFENIA